MSGHSPRPIRRSGESELSHTWRLRHWGNVSAPAPPPSPPPPVGLQPPNPGNFWMNSVGNPVPAGTPGAIWDELGFLEATSRYDEILEGREGPAPAGPTGPTAAELAIDRSKVHSQNLATYIDGVIRGLQSDIDARRLTTEQAVGEFNRRLDAMETGGSQFLQAQPYTIPRGVEHVPGFEPGGIATQLGMQPFRASPVEFDPFGMANQIVQETPELTGIGTPSTDPRFAQALEILRGLL